MKTILVLVATAAAVLFVAGCGGGGGTFNVDKQFSKEVGAESVCSEEGFEEIAGEREMTYTCSFQHDGMSIPTCVVIVDDEFYIARHERC